MIRATERDSRILSEIVDRVKNLRGGPGIRVSNGPGGITISLAPVKPFTPQANTPQRPRYRITAVTGSFPAWSYTVQLVTGYDSSQTGAARWATDGTDITGVLNAMEFAPPAGTYPYTYGNGSNITASDGTIDNGSCKIIPIGVGAVVTLSNYIDQNDGTTIVRSFSMGNGAGSS